jgi:hypothetical protein
MFLQVVGSTRSQTVFLNRVAAEEQAGRSVFRSQGTTLVNPVEEYFGQGYLTVHQKDSDYFYRSLDVVEIDGKQFLFLFAVGAG